MPRAPTRFTALLLTLALSACHTAPELRATAPPAGETPAPRPADLDRGTFTVPASMNDTWNAVGQVLIHLDGVTYETRAQMLGLYAVRYRGEQFLILTRGVVATQERKTIATEVRAAYVDGKPHHGEAAVELLQRLQRRMPAELARIGAK